MRKRIAKFGVTLALALTFVLLSVPALRAQGTAEATFKAKCAGCHGADGSGSTPAGKAMNVRDFQSADVQKETVDELAAIISNGKNKMPKYADKLKDAEIKDLAAYVHDLGKKK